MLLVVVVTESEFRARFDPDHERRDVSDVDAGPNVRVDLRAAEVHRGDRVIPLSSLELKLLRYLVEHRGEAVSREVLLDRVWGYDASPVTRTVDVRIASLRRKLEENPENPNVIVTVHGVGYKLVDARR